MMLVFDPVIPWSYLAAAVAVTAVLLILLQGMMDARKNREPWQALGPNKKIRLTALALSLAAGILFAVAAMNPVIVETRRAGVHLQVAVDVSDSVLRAEGGWEGIRRRNAQRLKEDISRLPGEIRKNGTAGLMTFRGKTAAVSSKIPLEKLPEVFAQLSESQFATGEGTNIEAALEEAGNRLTRSGGRGAVLLVGDGNQTAGDGREAAEKLARQGIPVFVYPLSSRGPALAITAANLPNETHAQVETFLRGVLTNRNAKDTGGEVSLGLSINGGMAIRPEKSRRDTGLSQEKKISLPPGQWMRLRWPVVFQGHGLQYLGLRFGSTEAGSVKGGQNHRRRFFTHVNRPPEILAIGGDNRWANAIPDDMAVIRHMAPESFDPDQHLTNVDAVVLGSITARQFSPGALDSLAKGIKNTGLGLLLINGNHQDNEPEDETVLMSYNDTPLEPLLPVKSGPHASTPVTPPRNVVVLIDTSGSMRGPNLAMAKKVTAYIIEKLLRPVDRLDLITFTTGAGHLVNDRLMDKEGKQEALDLLDQVSAGGGTDPNAALALVRDRKLSACGLIFISDGYFGHVGYRPDCRATVFAIGRKQIPRKSPLWLLADPFPVGYDFDPAAIRIPYFDPEKRLKFFEPGVFNPMSMAGYLPKGQRLPVPSLPLRGSAISYVKEEALLNGVRPRLTDPVLAYGSAGAGQVGVFTSGITGRWLASEEGKKAIAAWVMHVVPYMARDRYVFRLRDNGEVIDLRVALKVKNRMLPDVSGMWANVRVPGRAGVDVPLRTDDVSPGVFTGQVRVERGHKPLRAVLVLRETGPGALARPQRVPFMIPPRGRVGMTAVSEDFSYGRNRGLLQAIASEGGGWYDPAAGTPFFRDVSASAGARDLWIYLLALGALFYLSSIALSKWSS